MVGKEEGGRTRNGEKYEEAKSMKNSTDLT